MPKKRRFTHMDQEFLGKRLSDSRSIFFEFRSIASSYFCRGERIRIRTERLLEGFDELLKELRTMKPK